MLFEVIMPGEAANDTIEFAYQRKGKSKEHPNLDSAVTVINVAYDVDEMPVGGTRVVEYTKGEWKIL